MTNNVEGREDQDPILNCPWKHMMMMQLLKPGQEHPQQQYQNLKKRVKRRMSKSDHIKLKHCPVSCVNEQETQMP